MLVSARSFLGKHVVVKYELNGEAHLEYGVLQRVSDEGVVLRQAGARTFVLAYRIVTIRCEKQSSRGDGDGEDEDE